LTTPTDTNRSDIEAAIAALEGQRAQLGSAVVDIALAPLRARLEALDAASGRDDALRLVSVLFLDVVGSTAISRGLDPEDVRAIFHSALRRFSDVVTRHGGTVLRYAGDGMLALFGAHGVREDDAERAVRCGLALIDEANVLAPQLQADHGVADFDVRVGISTGSVLLSSGVGDGYDVSGIAVSVAARMEQTAPVGTLRISHHTFAHVRELFEAAEQPPIAVKGLEQPIVTYLVTAARQRQFGLATKASESAELLPVVGRDREFSTLDAAFDDVASSREAKIVMLAGEAGMGKSRLLVAFGNRLERRKESNARFYARAQTYGPGVPYGLLRDLFFWRFGIADSNSLPDAAKKLAEGLTPIFGNRADEQVALVGQLIGLDFTGSATIAGILDDPRQLRDRAFHAVIEFLRASSKNSAVVVLLFDVVHWADEGSVDFIRHLSRTRHRIPILCVCGARPDLFVPDATAKSELAAYERIDIAPLAPAPSRALADALLRDIEDRPDALTNLIVGRAEGNPFYMEEIVQMLIDDEVIIERDGMWRVIPERLVGFRVPPTLAGVLQARVDALSATEKSCLQAASVVGAVFWDEAVAHIDTSNANALPRLVDRHLVARHEHTAFEGAGELAFHHHLLHRVTYDTVLKRAKRAHHGAIAHWLVARTADRTGEFAGLIAHHFENAGDAQQAVAYLTKAAEHAEKRFQKNIAADHLTRALALITEEDLASRFDIVSRRAWILGGTDRPAEQEADVATLEQLANALNDDQYRARAAAARAAFAVVAGDFEGAARAAQTVATLAALLPASTVCFARIHWARAVQYQGDYAQAQMHVEESLRLARQANERRAERVAVCQLGLIDGELGRFSSARRHFDEALQTARNSGDKTMEGIVINNLAAVEQAVGNYPQARALLESGQRLSSDVGDAVTGAYALCNLAAVIRALGDPTTSVELAMEGVEHARRANARDLEANALVIVGDAQMALGRLDDARASYESSLAVFRQLGREIMTALPLSKLAKVALDRGDIDTAMRHVAEIVEHIDAGQPLDRSVAAAIHFECYNVMVAAGHARAGEFLALAYDEVLRQANELEPPERATFTSNVDTNAAIIAAAQAQPSTTAPLR
jgi:class 3 adenylate cyclase/tetratricopeptide (TPR) repeat protein